MCVAVLVLRFSLVTFMSAIPSLMFILQKAILTNYINTYHSSILQHSLTSQSLQSYILHSQTNNNTVSSAPDDSPSRSHLWIQVLIPHILYLSCIHNMYQLLINKSCHFYVRYNCLLGYLSTAHSIVHMSLSEYYCVIYLHNM